METVFGLDIDGVIRNITDACIDLYNSVFKGRMTFEDWKEYDVDRQFPDIREKLGVSAAEWLFNLHGKELFRYGNPIGVPSDSVERLRKFGDVIIISCQKSTENKTDTLEWLAMNGIVYDGICFVKDKSLVHVDYLIDDNPHYLVNSDCDHAILIDAPYNRNTVFAGKGSGRTYERFDSLESFVKHFEKENEKKE